MERKNITNTAKLVISVWNIGLFALVWYLEYYRRIFHAHAEIAYVISTVVYVLIYLWFCNTYRAFKLASSSVGELIFDQVISFGAADLVLYLVCCIGSHGYVNVLPGLVACGIQILGTIGIIIGTKRYFVRHIKPNKTLVIYGKSQTFENAKQFSNRLLKKYRHIFSIEEIIEETSPNVISLIAQYHTILLFETSVGIRETLIKICYELRKKFYYTPNLQDLVNQGSSYRQLLDTPLMKYDYGYEDKPRYVVKRIFDLVVSCILLILFSPIFCIVAIAIKLEDHGPVFFLQKRYTKDEKIFEIIKFRSMIVDAEKDGVQPCTGNDARVTKVGRIIRKTRIDEIPQLLNILKGEMSLVGPRPERIEHVKKYTKEMPEFSYRLRVKGGLTGYAQIYGKYNTSAYDKLRLDLMYIENQSLLVDIKILMLTFRTMFQKERTEGFDALLSEELVGSNGSR